MTENTAGTKSDYTYIALLDEKTTAQIKEIQKNLTRALGPSAYMDQWEPHVTLSFGNLLSQGELEEVKGTLAEAAKSFMATEFYFKGVVLKEKQEGNDKFVAIRLKLQESLALDNLSKAITAVAKEYEIPFDNFTEDHFHVGLGRYKGNVDEELVKKIVCIENLSFPSIESFSIYYSMMNDPKPPKALEVMTFLLSL